MIQIVLLILHVMVCLWLIMVVLLQTGKRADLAGAFGGGGSQTAFGARGASSLLTRVTAWSGGIFFLTSLLLAVIASSQQGGSSVLDKSSAPGATPPAATQTAPAAPGVVPPDSGEPGNPGEATPPAAGTPGTDVPADPADAAGTNSPQEPGS